MGVHAGWSERERELVEALIKAIKEDYSNPLKHAADEVRMHYTTARNTLYRMRNRYDKMRRALEDYANWRRQIRGRRYL